MPPRKAKSFDSNAKYNRRVNCLSRFGKSELLAAIAIVEERERNIMKARSEWLLRVNGFALRRFGLPVADIMFSVDAYYDK